MGVLLSFHFWRLRRWRWLRRGGGGGAVLGSGHPQHGHAVWLDGATIVWPGSDATTATGLLLGERVLAPASSGVIGRTILPAMR